MIERLDDGLWAWRARHPEWHPGKWGAEVVSFAVAEPGRTLLIDPLVPDDLWDELDGVVAGVVEILITIPYHVRSSSAASARYGGARVWGHPACAKRLEDPSVFCELRPDSAPGRGQRLHDRKASPPRDAAPHRLAARAGLRRRRRRDAGRPARVGADRRRRAPGALVRRAVPPDARAAGPARHRARARDARPVRDATAAAGRSATRSRNRPGSTTANARQRCENVQSRFAPKLTGVVNPMATSAERNCGRAAPSRRAARAPRGRTRAPRR